MAGCYNNYCNSKSYNVISVLSHVSHEDGKIVLSEIMLAEVEWHQLVDNYPASIKCYTHLPKQCYTVQCVKQLICCYIRGCVKVIE